MLHPAMSKIGRGSDGTNRKRVALHRLVVNEDDFTVENQNERMGDALHLCFEGTIFLAVAWLQTCFHQVPEAVDDLRHHICI